MTGVEKYNRKYKKQQDCQTAVFCEDHKENTTKLAGIGKHADDTGSKKFFHSIYIPYKTGSNGSGIMGNKGICRQMTDFLAQNSAQFMSDTLSEDGQKAFTQGCGSIC